jgi:nitroimidazol reductase NimA-like FMN-containing flavoprotein (pyridoxamine 5'-phosphate oxidase superfamily)
MSGDYEVSRQNKVRQLREKAAYDRDSVHAVLDAGLVAHVAFVQDDGPVVVPMLYARHGETIYVHGARKARIIRMLESTPRACLNVTLVDGLVIARSAFSSSMNYRSATVFGRPTLVDDRDGKLEAMRVISEHLMPGRWDELRAPLEREIKMTGIVAIDIESASAKISAKSSPDDEEDDYEIPIWAGILPLESRYTTLVDGERLIDGVEPSPVVRALEGKRF